MYEFLEYVLSELRTSFAWVILATVCGLGILAVTYVLHKRKYKGERKFPWAKAFLWLVFAGYMAIVMYATILRGMGGYRDWNLHLFRAWREAWNNYSAKNWLNVLLNVAMFLPLGFLLPLLGKRFRKWFLAIPTGFAVSLGIELLQLAIGRGICDVDDLFANTLGNAIGYFLVMALLALSREKGSRLKPFLVNSCLFLALVMSICTIFIVYEVKEYGNLPMAAAYRNNTGDTAWTLDCELPVVEDKLPVYQTQTRSIADCDAFAEEFKEITGAEYSTISYYQEAAYYMDQFGDENGTHFLFVSYLDPSYEYSFGIGDSPVYVEADRETMEAALAKYPVFIPDYAEFTVEGEGWHSFTVERHIDGAMMVDGKLRCRYAEDGTIRELQNNLLSYTYYDTVSVISPEDAYQRLCNGEFYDGGFFENKNPADVSVFTCTLSYEIDTKGFYQPVYYFDVASADGNYQDYIMIPAMQ